MFLIIFILIINFFNGQHSCTMTRVMLYFRMKAASSADARSVKSNFWVSGNKVFVAGVFVSKLAP